MNYRKVLLILLLLPYISFSQQPLTLASVDSFAIRASYKRDLVALTRKLTSPYETHMLKARAIFKWITENIDYDYKFYNRFYYKGKEPKTYRCRERENCEDKRKSWETKYINKILRKKKAVCQGYSMLFQKMCEYAGLKSEIIPGYIRTEPFQVGSAGTLDHAWNAIWLDSAYFLLDVTWAAGGCSKDEDGKLLDYRRNFNEYYWLTPAFDFARNHFPVDNKWTLLPNYTRDSFAANPYYHPGEIQNIKLRAPSSGVISVKKGDTIRFELEYAGTFKDLQINSNLFRNPEIWVWDKISRRKQVRRLDTLAVKKQHYVAYERNGNVYEFEHFVAHGALYYLDILLDRRRVMRFKVVTGK